MQYKLLTKNQDWDAETAVVATCSFTTGSCSLCVYKLTGAGCEWAKQDKQSDLSQSLFEKVQLILSDKFLGFFMVPEGGAWNYNFNGQNFSPNMRYSLQLDTPKDFYHEAHRTIHFLDFAIEPEEPQHDREDHFN